MGVCVICLQRQGRAKPRLEPCGHCGFHFRCIRLWLRVKPVCPLCMAHVEIRTGPAEPCFSSDERIAAGIQRRTRVYQLGLRARYIGANRISKFRNWTPAMLRRDEELVSRAKRWIRRELLVFSYLQDTNAEFLQEYILSIIKSVDIQHETVHRLLAEFLGPRDAGIFIHELRMFLRSPFTDLVSYDQSSLNQYSKPLI